MRLPSWFCATSVNSGLAAIIGLLLDGLATAGMGAALAWAVPFVSKAWRAIAAAIVFVVELFYLTLLELTLVSIALARTVVTRRRRPRGARGPKRPRRRRG